MRKIVEILQLLLVIRIRIYVQWDSTSHQSELQHQKISEWWMLERIWRKENPPTLLVEYKLIQPLWRAIWKLLKKQKIELQYDPAIPLLSIYLEKNMVRNNSCTPVLIAMLFTIPGGHGSNLNVHWQIKKIQYIYTKKYY